MQQRHRQLAKWAKKPLIESQRSGISSKRSWWKKALTLISLALMCISWANPQWGTRKEQVKAQSTDVIIALDISHSMLAQDISPSRLERSKRFIQKLIEALQSNRIGLIFFAGGAYLQMPLTNDYAAAALFVQSANTDQAGTQGTAIDEAVELAIKAFDPGADHQKALILLSDGEDHDADAVDAVTAARDQNIFTYTVAVGTEEGAFIPIIERGAETYKRDSEGNPVRTQLNIPYLQEVASAGDGRFYLVNQGQEAIDDLKIGIDNMQKREVEMKSFTDYNSYFGYFLALAILLLVLESLWSKFPTKQVVQACFIFIISVVSGWSAQAQSAHKQLRNGDRYYDQGQYDAAEEAYRKAIEKKAEAQGSYNLGNSLYQQERLEEATAQYESATKSADPEVKSKAYFNLGNAHFGQQAYDKAVDSYKNALKYNPDDEEAKENLMAAKQMLQMMPPPPPQQGDGAEQEENQDQEQQQNQQQPSEEDQSGNSASTDPEQQAQQPMEPSDELSKEDAKKLLEVIDAEDKKVQEKMRKQDGQKKKPKKDW